MIVVINQNREDREQANIDLEAEAVNYVFNANELPDLEEKFSKTGGSNFGGVASTAKELRDAISTTAQMQRNAAATAAEEVGVQSSLLNLNLAAENVGLQERMATAQELSAAAQGTIASAQGTRETAQETRASAQGTRALAQGTSTSVQGRRVSGTRVPGTRAQEAQGIAVPETTINEQQRQKILEEQRKREEHIRLLLAEKPSKEDEVEDLKRMNAQLQLELADVENLISKLTENYNLTRYGKLSSDQIKQKNNDERVVISNRNLKYNDLSKEMEKVNSKYYTENYKRNKDSIDNKHEQQYNDLYSKKRSLTVKLEENNKDMTLFKRLEALRKEQNPQMLTETQEQSVLKLPSIPREDLGNVSSHYYNPTNKDPVSI
jgi:hypothetical protein